MAMPEINVKITGASRTKKTFIELAKRVNNMKPVWKNFRDFYRDDMMKKSFETKGALMEGGKWADYTPAYQKWKKKNYGYGSKIPNLKNTDKLYNAATGKSGWYDKIGSKDLIMGVRGKDYFYLVQHRSKNPRFYFYTKKEDLPNKAWAYLVKITNEYLEGADK